MWRSCCFAPCKISYLSRPEIELRAFDVAVCSILTQCRRRSSYSHRQDPPCCIVVSNVITALTESVSCRMELVWHGEFDSFFRQFYPHTWSLYPTTEAPYACAQSGWYSYRDSAKVRFHCKVRTAKRNTRYTNTTAVALMLFINSYK